jgi:hypothetical protein
VNSKEWQAARSQVLSQGVDEQVRGMLCTWTQMEHRNKLGARIDGEPEPQHLFSAAQPCAQFVQLQVRLVEMEEEALVQGLCVLACASEPRGDGGLTVAEDSFGRGSIQSFGQCRQHHCNVMRRRFQTVQGSVAPGSEGGVARLAAKGLDVLGTAMLAISKKPRGSVHR